MSDIDPLIARLGTSFTDEALLECVLRCGLLGLLFRGAVTPSNLGSAEEHANHEEACMVGPGLYEHFVGRGNPPLLLRDLLEAALGVLVRALGDEVIKFSENGASDKCRGRVVPLVKVDGADDGLKCVGEDYLPRAARVLGLAF